MRRGRWLAIGLLCAALSVPMEAVCAESQAKSYLVIDSDPKYRTTVCDAGEEVELVVPLINKEKGKITNVQVTPRRDVATSVYPFEIEWADTAAVHDMEPGWKGQARFQFKTREDVSSGYVKVDFTVSYLLHPIKEDGTWGEPQEREATRSVYVRTVAKAEPFPTAEPTKEPAGTGGDSDFHFNFNFNDTGTAGSGAGNENGYEGSPVAELGVGELDGGGASGQAEGIDAAAGDSGSDADDGWDSNGDADGGWDSDSDADGGWDSGQDTESDDGADTDSSSDEGAEEEEKTSGDSDKKKEGKRGTPRVIIESFSTVPTVIQAGDRFQLKLRVRNTSKKTEVSNMILTLRTPQAGEAETAADAFLPLTGSNTLYVEKIDENSSREVSIDMTARADLVQKPYPIEIGLNYEDKDTNPFEGTLNISIPVRQKPRFQLSSVQVMPEAIAVGEEANVTFEIYNLGKTKLYNISAKLEDDSLKNGEAFVGNLEAGAKGSVDMMVQGAAQSSGDGTVRLVIKYEDQDGNQGTFRDKCILFVMPEPDVTEDEAFDMSMMGMEGESEQKKSPVGWIIGGIAAAGGTAAAVIFLKRQKRRKEEEWANEILGSDKDELQ